jgi:hypothetical protein
MTHYFFNKERGIRARLSQQIRQAALLPHSMSTRQHDWSASGTSTRTEVCPPALFAQSQPLWQRWVSTAWQWLWDEEDLENHPRVLRDLEQVRHDFIQALWDLQSIQASHVREKINDCRSLRDLWHLRVDLYQLIATYQGEAQAQARLDGLNRHFPVRINVIAHRVN